MPPQALAFRTKGQPGENTTLVVVATDAMLTKAQATVSPSWRRTVSRARICPVHTPLDGDIVFAAATGASRSPIRSIGLAELGALAADVVARAIARGVYEAHGAAVPRRAAELEGQVFGK